MSTNADRAQRLVSRIQGYSIALAAGVADYEPTLAKLENAVAELRRLKSELARQVENAEAIAAVYRP